MKANGKSNATNRVSALERLSKPSSSNVQQRLSAPTTPTVTDARQLLANRNTAVFDARQLLSRQSSNSSSTGRKEIVQSEEDEDHNPRPLFMTRLSDVRPTAEALGHSMEKKNIRNSKPTESVSFTKKITNTLFQEEPPRSSQVPLLNQKIAVSFVNDQYRKRSRSPSPPPIIRRLHNPSPQTSHSSSSSRPPIRTKSHRRPSDEDEDHYEPPMKRSSATTTAKAQSARSAISKRTSADVPVSARMTQSSSHSDDATVLITNLRSSVTEDDILELFGELGTINAIKRLSRGCVQVTYAKEEHAEQAVTNYHNQSLDGQPIYVSLQQPSSKTDPIPHGLDPAFIRQALFNPSNNTARPVQFQVKL